MQLGLSSKTLPEQTLFDLGQNFLRTQLATVQGAATPYPYGGKIRQVQVDLDMPRLQAHGLSPSDVVNAINAQNMITPVRHGQDRLAGVPGGDEQRPETHRRAERSAGQDR